MDAFLTRKKRKTPPVRSRADQDEESTDVKLALLSSLFPEFGQEVLLEFLLDNNGSVEETAASIGCSQAESSQRPQSSRNVTTSVGSQSSLRLFAAGTTSGQNISPKKAKLLSKRGTTLHLYDPKDIAEHTPCSVVHNFLPPDEANALLYEMLDESKTFEKTSFKLFDNIVSSPHTSSFYVETQEELDTQKYEYFYNGARLTDIRRLTPQLKRIKPRVQLAVNNEIQHRIKTRYPGGQKLRYQSPQPWVPNAAFANSYDGPQENVGWHSDQLTYLGPRSVIGSLSLGVAREFRVRRVIPRNSDPDSKAPDDHNPDAEGQIAIHLPHNSLLVMHAEMQEEWKHSIAPAQNIDPHPVAGNKRINITYRDYKANLHPKFTPRCKCGVPCVLRVVQKKKENWGKYFWMCHAGNVPGKESCTFFSWADFDDDGNPSWDKANYNKREKGSTMNHERSGRPSER